MKISYPMYGIAKIGQRWHSNKKLDLQSIDFILYICYNDVVLKLLRGKFFVS